MAFTDFRKSVKPFAKQFTRRESEIQQQIFPGGLQPVGFVAKPKPIKRKMKKRKRR